jgi:hypothetical protein
MALSDDEDFERAWVRIVAEFREKRAEPAWYEFNIYRGQAAASTVEALVYQLRQGGRALKDPGAKRRLAGLSEQQLHEVSARLQRFQPHIARAWSPSEVELLVQLWSDLHG